MFELMKAFLQKIDVLAIAEVLRKRKTAGSQGRFT